MTTKPKDGREPWGTSFHDVRLTPAGRAAMRRVVRRLHAEGVGSLPPEATCAVPLVGDPFTAGAVAHYALLALEARLDATKKAKG